ncbi:MAG TPA: enoyl-CoA hydratase/isomerase family protein [Gemmatimonadales bacterium]
MSANRVLGSLADGVLTLTLNRPDKRNAMDAVMIGALHDAIEGADLDAGVRVVAIRGAGKDFCAGLDLAELLASADATPLENEASSRRLGDVFIRLRRLPKPVVAVVQGRALAGGCGLASACDLIVAHADAVFGYPEIQRGFVPAMVMAMLRRSVGENVAFDLAATGRQISAEEARQVGLVARVFPDASFERDGSALLRDLAGLSGSALALLKQQLHALEGLSFEDGIALGAQVNAVARTTPEFRRALERFLKKSTILP